MTKLTRRALLGTSAFAAAGLAVGCSSADDGGSTGGSTAGTGGGSSSGPTGSIDWWDHFSSFQDLNDDWAKKESSVVGATVVHTYFGAGKGPQAYQLAKQANKMPDVYSNIIGLPLAALISGGWVHELELADDVKAKIPENALTEGITNLDGKMYGFPMFSFRQRTGLIWFNRDHFTKAGLDPENPPASYSDFKDACNKLKGAGITPMTIALGGDGGRVRDEIEDMAQTAGFPGYQGQRFDTGEYEYHNDAYIQVIEFIKELWDSKLILAGSNTFSVVDSRTRFASGATGLYIDGIWCAGGCKALVPESTKWMSSGQTPTPDSVDPSKQFTYRHRPDSDYFVSKDSKNVDAATKLVGSFMDDEYQKGMIEAMDQPPLNLDLVDSSDALDAYKKVVAFCRKNVFAMPQAIVRNPANAKVDALRKPVTPHVGNIVQGYIGGSIKDLKGELKKLSDASQADLDQALKAATDGGAKVSQDDYAFSDWKPGADYTYQS